MNINSNSVNNKQNNNLLVKEFFIFNRNNTCLLHLDFLEINSIDNNSDGQFILQNKAVNQASDKKLENRYKLIYGLLFSMRTFVKKVSINKDNEVFKNFSTSDYKLHYLELINGLRFILITTPTKASYINNLKEIFRFYYNPLISNNSFVDKDAYITSDVFINSSVKYLKTLI